LVERTIEQHGRIDCVVAKAPGNPAFGPWESLGAAPGERGMAPNLRSTSGLPNLAHPPMPEGGAGTLFSMPSSVALLAPRSQGAYAVSKAAEAHLARNLAVEWGSRNIRVNAIAPGIIKTDFARKLWEDQSLVDRVVQQSPLGRIGEPQDVGGVAVFLACD